MILIEYPSTPVSKKGLNTSHKVRREASRNNFAEEGGMPNRINSFRETDRGKDQPRTQLEFEKSVANGLRKINNLI